MALIGSPPHVRGRATQKPELSHTLGITPACAGKRRYRTGKSRIVQDHPRMCGEECFLRYDRRRWRGSPPHVRGRGTVVDVTGAGQRITPACAGKSIQAHPAHSVSRDHPRMCGEEYPASAAVRLGVGSPPHVRGRARVAYLQGKRKGITPACAGKSVFGLVCVVLSRDHPRMCGEETKRIPIISHSV